MLVTFIRRGPEECTYTRTYLVNGRMIRYIMQWIVMHATFHM